VGPPGGAARPAPPAFVARVTDPATGASVGWEPVEQSACVRWFLEALGRAPDDLAPGTYELRGPHAATNPDRLARHALVATGLTEASG
jgi:hypothetical protein